MDGTARTLPTRERERESERENNNKLVKNGPSPHHQRSAVQSVTTDHEVQGAWGVVTVYRTTLSGSSIQDGLWYTPSQPLLLPY